MQGLNIKYFSGLDALKNISRVPDRGPKREGGVIFVQFWRSPLSNEPGRSIPPLLPLFPFGWVMPFGNAVGEGYADAPGPMHPSTKAKLKPAAVCEARCCFQG